MAAIGIQKLKLISDNETTTDVVIEIFEPVKIAEFEYECKVKFQGMYNDSFSLNAETSFSVICLTITFIKRLFNTFIENGNKLYFINDDISESSPIKSFEEFWR